MRGDINIILTLQPYQPSFCGKGFLSHGEPPKNAESRVEVTLLASLLFQCGSGNLLLAGCSSAEPVSSWAPRSAKLMQILELCSIYWIIADEAVLVFDSAFDNGECLPEEFVGNGDNRNFSRFTSGSQSFVCVAAFSIESSRREGCHIQQPSYMAVTIAVDMPSAVNGSARLFIGGRKSEIPGKLFGVVEVCEARSGNYESSGQSYAYAFDGYEKFELSVELFFCRGGQIFLHLGCLLFKKLDGILYRFHSAMVYNRKHLKGTLHISTCRKLFLELTQHRTHLLELHQRFSRDFVRLRLHAFSIQGYQASVCFVRFGCSEHYSREILDFKRILHADSNTLLGQKIEDCHAVRARGFHYAMAVIVDGVDKLADARRGVLKVSNFAILFRGVRHGESVFTDVDSDISHIVSLYSEASIHRELPLRNTGSFSRPNELSSLGCKSIVAEHFLGTFTTNEKAALLHALMLYLIFNFNNYANLRNIQ